MAQMMMEPQKLAHAGERPDGRMPVVGMVEAPGLRSGTGARHPVERLQMDYMRRAEQQNQQMKATVYGAHAPLRQKIECELASQFQRLPGLPSSLVGLETLMDMDDEIDFEDVLNLEDVAPIPRVTGPNRSVHDVMEQRLNMRF